MVLVDTNLLVFALMAREGHLTPETTASVRTLRSAGQVAISAMSWLEVQLHIRPLQRAALKHIAHSAPLWRIIDIDDRIASRAAELMTLRTADPQVCPSCWSVKRALPCKTCKRLVSRPQRFADAVIVATAECDPDIHVLYTFDSGVLDMGRLVTSIEIVRPQPTEREAALRSP